MKKLYYVASLAVLVSTIQSNGVAFAQDPAQGFQYRFRNESIPGASADEPIRSEFASDLARDYLDRGAELWASQKKCVSCHTHGLYTMVRPVLTSFWGRPPEDVRTFVVGQSQELRTQGQSTGSVPTQMAYIARGLAEWDAAFHKTTSPETDAALRFLFEMQAEDGSIHVRDRWPPLNADAWHGTVMAAMAAATAPGWAESVDNEPILEDVRRLEAYLRRTPPKNDHQSLLLLWASTRIPNLLSDERRQELVDMTWTHQRPDGGWSIRTFATPETWGGGVRSERLVAESDYLDPPSDGYQTGLAVVVLRDSGVPTEEPRIQKAVAWLLSNQRESGRWWTRSLNTESRFHFITYSGTAYAALALARCDALPVIVPDQ